MKRLAIFSSFNYPCHPYSERVSKTGPLRFGSENQFPLNFAHDYILVQSNWNGISFWKYFKIKFFGTKIASAPGGQFFALTKSKNSAYCRVYHFKVFRFQQFFSLLRLKLVLKRCKAHNFEPSKACNSYLINIFRFTPTLPYVGKGSKMHIFILAPSKIPTSSKQNIYLDQWNKCSKTGKHKKKIVISANF